MEFFDFALRAQNLIMFFNPNVNAVLFGSMLAGLLCFALVYVFQTVALVTISKREGFKQSWMAYVPFFNTYYIGVVSKKNKIYKTDATKFSLALALVELAYVVASLVKYVAFFALAQKGYVTVEFSDQMLAGEVVKVPVRLMVMNGIPAELTWAGWVANNIELFVISWLEFVYIVLDILVLKAFFQTYATRNYWLFSFFAVIFPVKGILFFVVKNNKAKSYREYLAEQQSARYRMYQQYNQQDYNSYRYNPYSGKSNPQNDADPYQNSTPRGNDDPFGGLGSNGNSSGATSQNGSQNGNQTPPDDPFGGFGA